ncbi:MAG: nicotinate (nicotinamide) nucleotide adenylyltransferase [Elusimicrobiota bacterium]
MAYILYGGLFDPPHAGHFEIATTALNKLDAEILYWIPSRRPPHRKGAVLGGRERYELLKRCLASYDKMRVSDVELNSGHSGYTVETVEILKKKYPRQKCYLLTGSDEAENFTQWKNWKKILCLAELVVGKRKENINLPKGVSASFLDNKIIDVSSSQIRRKIREGKSVRDDLMPGVLKVIKEKSFYK